nr:MAG TPA: Cro/C1-type HTH DNA-binding domain protein [Caudoviricetes sp.]
MGKVSDVIDARLLELGIKGSKMCDDLGISRSTLTELRKGRASTLKAERAVQIAEYLGLSVEQLLGNEEKPAPESRNGLSIKEQKDIAKKVDAFMASLENEKDLMFDGDPASDEALEDLRRAITVGYEMARIKNREKYNPYKNKNKK